MSMRVVFLKDYQDYMAGDDDYIPRPLGRNLCQQEIAAPWITKDSNLIYMAMKQAEKDKVEAEKAKALKKKAEAKEKMLKKKAEAKAKAEVKIKAKAEEEAKARKEKAISKEAETRETTIIS